MKLEWIQQTREKKSSLINEFFIPERALIGRVVALSETV